jgi:phosphoribosyl 1,2-cyclic phosphate phosphodiesterase
MTPSAIDITVLGSGTSAGVPIIGCHCAVCQSTDPHDKRMRPSIVVSYGGKHILVDTTPELRMQAIANNVHHIDAIVYTHAHADHIFGLDDVRRFNTVLGAALPLYAAPYTIATLRQCFPYAFIEEPDKRIYRPEVTPIEIAGPFELFGQTWTPIPMIHGKYDVFGFRIGDFAYCTDCNIIPESSQQLLGGLDVLIIDALRPRPHPTHLSFAQALDMIAILKPKRAFFTHLSHDASHAEIEADLPPHVRVAYDGLRIHIAP